ncbi:MAG: transglycosylase SLT domain-containing protein [Polymorphobacter sp.]
MTAIPGLASAVGSVRDVAAITAVVRDAAARTGVDFNYLLAQAKAESGLDPTARARTSSARGLYQFTSSTWLEMVRRHGDEHGLGWAAEMINKGAARAGSAARATILALRDNAGAAALMAGEFAGDNAAILEKRLGRTAGAADLYMAAFLGAGGATRFLSAMTRSPDAAAADLFPREAAANRSIFFGINGSPRSLTEIYNRMAAKIGSSVTSAARQPTSPAARQAASPATHRPITPADGNMAAMVARPAPVAPTIDMTRARLAYLLLAELGG